MNSISNATIQKLRCNHKTIHLFLNRKSKMQGKLMNIITQFEVIIRFVVKFKVINNS